MSTRNDNLQLLFKDGRYLMPRGDNWFSVYEGNRVLIRKIPASNVTKWHRDDLLRFKRIGGDEALVLHKRGIRALHGNRTEKSNYLRYLEVTKGDKLPVLDPAAKKEGKDNLAKALGQPEQNLKPGGVLADPSSKSPFFPFETEQEDRADFYTWRDLIYEIENKTGRRIDINKLIDIRKKYSLTLRK